MCDECRRLVDDPLDIPDETLLYRRVHWDQLGGRKVYASGETAKLSATRSVTIVQTGRTFMGGGPCMSIECDHHARQEDRTRSNSVGIQKSTALLQ